ncbi:pentatricopeptide repeat-containing protein At5g48910 [Aristolochia californica]|uniref:pentatricopeptide repeat-containing protein At5g48910 n=1 Tax=Aristolochia californica TaxID=171875 RepID=UPI0035D79B70
MHAMILSNSLFPIVSPAPGAGHRSSSSSTCIETKQCKTIRELQQIHALIIKTGGIRDPVTAAEILHLYALSHFRDLPYARTVFNCMETPNCFSWNTIIRAFAESDDPAEALNLYCKMLNDEFVRPNGYTIPSVLKACARVSGVREGRQVHCQVVKLGLVEDGFILSNLLRMYVIACVMDDAQKLFNRNIRLGQMSDERGQNNVVLWNVMVDGCIRNGDIGAARNLFDRMPQRSVVSWNEMIAGYAQNGFFKEALEIFRDMQISNIQPNYLTLVSVLPAVSRLGSLDLGKWLHAYAEKNRIKLDEVLGSAFIHMYAKCGDIEKALKLFEALPQRNVVTWNVIIGGLAMHGRANDALSFFFEMEKSGIAPTDVTFITVLNACSHAGLVDEGRSCFNKMVTVYDIRPRLEHYGCMVDMLGRSGLPEEAEKLVLNMPIEADDVIWKALLSACRIHGKIEIGKRVAEHLMELAPQDSGCYVLLSNLYASLGDWEAVAKVRLMMKEMDIRKDPGCSSIIIDGIVYEFLVDDDLHPRAKEIHSMLEEMASKLRSVGYRPDTSHVLLNVGEEKKESILYYHSEKIAIAFGLISTSPSTPLQITKNLRICGDCHSAIKLISKLYDRKIIVRDCNRFHHFENGSCSCMDYW